MKNTFLFPLILLLSAIACNSKTGEKTPKAILSGFRFTEGPALHPDGRIFFSDVPEKKIYIYEPEKDTHLLFMDSTGGANGLWFANANELIGCAGRVRQVISISPEKKITVLASHYQGKMLNSPNDLWMDKAGGIYFTDPRYGNRDNLEQDGEHVYYISPDGSIQRVINTLTRPNGIIGSTDEKTLYVVDEGQRKTFSFEIVSPGKVTNKQLFCEGGIDGMSRTDKGNICITKDHSVVVYSPEGKLLQKTAYEAQPTNVLFVKGILYVTTQSGELYKEETEH